MDHIAIMKKTWGLTEKILDGRKKIESRWYLKKYRPWNVIKARDTVYFKNSGEPVTIKARVERIAQFSDLNPKQVKKILNKYGNDDGIEPQNIKKFYEIFKNKRYCILVFLRKPVAIKPFTIDKTGFGAMSSWILANNVNRIKKNEFEMKQENKNLKNKKPIVVAVSGGYDPLHVGHVRLFQEARKLGDELVVILNNDNWLRKKKGFIFMSEKERKEVINAIKSVDRVVLTGHKASPKDMSVCAELKKIRPAIFANGGDRTLSNIPEAALCKSIDCKLVFNVGKGGKIQSSSWLVGGYGKASAKR